ncbi:MAG: hypothetical protein IT281_01320 [Ignavibacteria bacterium]|nr:hypothetical protein [Ignavibacteria bacterium]MCC7158161.1 hypothetical protein [Ignavibacteria bacterium]
MKIYSKKTAKGYRLKPETHNLIKSLQELTLGDADEVLNASCMMYLSFVAGKNFEAVNQSKENINLKSY